MDRWLLLRNNTEDGTVKQIKGNWTPEEDMILKNKVAEYGLKKWKEIATFLPGRIGKQCRERWYNNVDPNLNKDKWTIAEDLQLMELHKLYGKNIKVQILIQESTQETPAELQRRILKDKKQQAEQSIMDDGSVKKILATFDATIIKDSIVAD